MGGDAVDPVAVGRSLDPPRGRYRGRGMKEGFRFFSFVGCEYLEKSRASLLSMTYERHPVRMGCGCGARLSLVLLGEEVFVDAVHGVRLQAWQ
jgi:hypothetical protein